ncbi:helix-turn-helix domain-containing protein [Orrella sp. 11846]|uniref:helix-turn-helix domain-containing protein n=1 Tax=Orrella sp. 11846 TaxID=3409913 RepID=UPI003B58F26B
MSRTIRGHTIELRPNNVQATHFSKACGIARLSYNWALSEWQRQFQADKDYRNECLAQDIQVDQKKLNAPSQGKLRRQLNAIKREQFPFMLEVTKCAPQLAIIQLGVPLSVSLPDRANIQDLERKVSMIDSRCPTINFTWKKNESRFPSLALLACERDCVLTARSYPPKCLGEVSNGS